MICLKNGCTISPRRWRNLYPSLRVVRTTGNTVLYRQADHCERVHIVVRGHVKLSRVDADGDQSTRVVLPAGELFGADLSGAGSRRASDTASTKGAAEIFAIERTRFFAGMAEDSAVASFVIDRLATRQAFLAGRVEQLLGGNVRRRITTVLSELAGAYGGRCAHGHEIDIRLTQQELAEMSGASRPTVSTVLNRLREQGVVSYTRHYICIDDLSALNDIASGMAQT